MNEANTAVDLDQTDEYILSPTFSDEALEKAASCTHENRWTSTCYGGGFACTLHMGCP